MSQKQYWVQVGNLSFKIYRSESGQTSVWMRFTRELNGGVVKNKDLNYDISGTISTIKNK